MTPFDEDQFVATEAEKRGLRLHRRAVIDIDAAALPDNYYRRVPDYAKIRRHLDEGVAVPGARLTTLVEYILSPVAAVAEPVVPL